MPPEPDAAMPWNAVMTPTTVPSSPTNGAVEPMVASAEMMVCVRHYLPPVGPPAFFFGSVMSPMSSMPACRS